MMLFFVCLAAIASAAPYPDNPTSSAAFSSTEPQASTASLVENTSSSTAPTPTSPDSTASAAPASLNLKPTASTWVGNVTSLSSNIVRDLGWRGNIGSTSLLSYGDSLWCSDPDENTCTIFASNTVALSTSEPLKVQDFDTSGDHNLPPQFCPFQDSFGETPIANWGMGISNVVGVSDTQGLMLFWRNYRPPIPGVPVGSELQNNYLGGGTALVDNSGPFPVCTRQQAQFWNATEGEPLYGDHGLVDGRDGFIYAFGGGNGSETDVFMARVPVANALEADKFEYWNGATFSPTRLTFPGPDQAVLRETNAGTIFFYEQQNTWISLTRSAGNLKGLTVRTAPAITGPWSDETLLYEGGEGPFIYGPIFHPELQDPAKGGKDWFVSFTGLPNIQQMVRLDMA